MKYQKKYDKHSGNVKILLISKLFLGNIWWFRKMFVLLHSLLRNTISQALKKEFFERFYINRQVVQEAVNFLEIRKLTGQKETNRQAIDKSGLLSFNKRKGYSS